MLPQGRPKCIAKPISPSSLAASSALSSSGLTLLTISIQIELGPWSPPGREMTPKPAHRGTANDPARRPIGGSA